MRPFEVPSREQVAPADQAHFDALQSRLGMVPNLYATFALSPHALGTVLALQSARSTLPPQAREAVNLVVSQVNDCAYCLAAHTVIGGMVGLQPQQLLALRAGRAPFDDKLDALVRLAREIAVRRGRAEDASLQRFFAAGWTRAQFVDLIVLVGDKTISNCLHGLTQVPIDFPPAPPLPA